MHRAQDHLDDAVQHASNGLRSARYAAEHGYEEMADSAADLRDRAAARVDRLTGHATDAARHGLDWMRDGGDRVRHRVAHASERTVGYVRDEPVRSVLIAAAAGALLFALVRIAVGRSRR